MIEKLQTTFQTQADTHDYIRVSIKKAMYQLPIKEIIDILIADPDNVENATNYFFEWIKKEIIPLVDDYEELTELQIIKTMQRFVGIMGFNSDNIKL
jgi:hypothetical protein